MRMLENLEPKEVFFFFEEICKIPHGSGNTDQISKFLKTFAEQRDLEHYQDELGNMIIIKEATPGYEDHEPVMLQGHMDMVAVKEPDCLLDMAKYGLRLFVDGDRLSAVDTSLGGDDGVALAYGLALLDGDGYKHPRIEVVFTVDEEVGMDGARALDVTPLKATRLINLDSEEEGIFLAGCAGGARVNLSLSGDVEKRVGIPCEIKISGLKGGHSGEEIHKQRGNGICILGRALKRLSAKIDFVVCNLEGGVADNAIPTSARAKILITGYQNREGRQKVMQDGFAEQECLARFKYCNEKLQMELQEEFAQRDGKGVMAMSVDIEGLVETSLNPGLLSYEHGKMKIGISVRSSVESAKTALIDRLKSLAGLAGADVEVTGEYPGWNYRTNSPLREKMIKTYEEMYQKNPEIKAIHAGVECGILASKISGLDCVSIGPDMKDIHTTGEELSIASTGRVWDFLVKLLENM